MDSTPRPNQSKRRTISPAQKLAYLDGYEQAIQHGEGGGYLRSNGIYSSQIAEWGKLRDSGILDEKTDTGTKRSTQLAKGKMSQEQAEVARMKNCWRAVTRN